MGREVTALAPWFGSNRTLASHVGAALEGCNFVAIPFAGGMCEVPHIKARTLAINDMHRHVVNLARVAADGVLGPKLYREVRRTPFHPDSLAAAQERCRKHGDTSWPSLPWAIDYFVCCWMGRSAVAGTEGEFSGKPAMRWDAAGGDSAVRYQSAVRSLVWWRQTLRRATFTTLDAFDFLAKCKDKPGHGLYVDAPWPDDGDGYAHKFGESQQRRLAIVLAAYQQTRVVVRFGDHLLIRELYPEPLWTWHLLTGRTMANKAKAEVLIVKNGG